MSLSESNPRNDPLDVCVECLQPEDECECPQGFTSSSALADFVALEIRAAESNPSSDPKAEATGHSDRAYLNEWQVDSPGKETARSCSNRVSLEVSRRDSAPAGRSSVSPESNPSKRRMRW